MFKPAAKAGLMLAAAAMLWSGAALAGTVTLTLTRVSTLTNVTDTAGTTQHEAGTISKGANVVGEYFIQRRVESLANPAFNTGAEHITLFFPVKQRANLAPENITIDGAHDFSSGAFKGSVSAASGWYSWIQNADAVYAAGTGIETLTLNWNAANGLTLP